MASDEGIMESDEYQDYIDRYGEEEPNNFYKKEKSTYSNTNYKNGDVFNIDVFKDLAKEKFMSYGYVIYPSGNGLIMHKVESGKLRKLLALASQEDAFKSQIYTSPKDKTN